jgi:hypothetical protein
MRGLRRAGTMIAVLAGLASACGSTANDRLVLRFLNFDNTGITQADSVRESSADVDIEAEICSVTMGTQTVEPFTQTSINAVFVNQQAADIRLESYTVDYGSKSGLPDAFKVFHGALSANLIGGRCGGGGPQCALDSDCSGGGGCVHSETTVTGIVIVDFDVKERITPGSYNVQMTFYGSDANRSFQTSAGYVMRFDDFNNCQSSGTGAGLS